MNLSKNIIKESEKKMEKVITEQEIKLFKEWLINKEKCFLTVQKYLRDLKKLKCFAEGKTINRELVLARKAGVEEKKIYPHNFRHMFAQCFYQICKDIVKVAALLGHSNTKTTLNYLKTTKQECRVMLNQMKFVVPYHIFSFTRE